MWADKNRIPPLMHQAKNLSSPINPIRSIIQYKCDNFYHPEVDGGISILDDTLGIDWKIPTEHANLSEKDTKHAMLKDFDSPFDVMVVFYI